MLPPSTGDCSGALIERTTENNITIETFFSGPFFIDRIRTRSLKEALIRRRYSKSQPKRRVQVIIMQPDVTSG